MVKLYCCDVNLVSVEVYIAGVLIPVINPSTCIITHLTLSCDPFGPCEVH